MTSTSDFSGHLYVVQLIKAKPRKEKVANSTSKQKLSVLLLARKRINIVFKTQ